MLAFPANRDRDLKPAGQMHAGNGDQDCSALPDPAERRSLLPPIRSD